MKSLILVAFAIALSCVSFAQSKNYRFCRENITANKDHAVVSTFSIDRELSNEEINSLKTNLYVKNSVYAFVTNSKRTEVKIYHLFQVHFEDLKLLVQDTNIELNFISTVTTEFRDENTINAEIER